MSVCSREVRAYVWDRFLNKIHGEDGCCCLFYFYYYYFAYMKCGGGGGGVARFIAPMGIKYQISICTFCCG